MIGFDDGPDRQTIAWIVENTIWVTRSNPAYLRVMDTEAEPYHIIADESADQFKMTTSLAKLAHGPRSIRSELAYLEADYGILIGALRKCLANAGQRRRADPRLMWLAGDYIIGFLARLDEASFYLLKPSETLASHLGVAAGSIRKILSFRNRFPRLSMVDPQIPWSKYRENKVPRPS